MCVGKPTDFMQDWARDFDCGFLKASWFFFPFVLKRDQFHVAATLHSLIDSTEAPRKACFERKKEGKCAVSGVEIAVAEYIRSVNDGDADGDALL